MRDPRTSGEQVILGRTLRLHGRASLDLLGRTLRLDRRASLDLLRQLARDRGVMVDLRRIYADEVNTSSLHMVRDEVVLARLAERIASGILTVSVLQRPELRAPPTGGDAPLALEPLRRLVAEEKKKKKKTATITNPRWSVDRVEVGKEVEAAFSYAGFVDDKSVTVTIHERDNGKPQEKIASLNVTVAAESGDHVFKWTRSLKDVEKDLKQDQAAGDKRPLEYVFEAESKAAGNSGLSGTLWLTNKVTVDLTKESGGKADERPRIVVLRDFERRERKRSEKGKAMFEKVIVGPVEIRLAKPRFTELVWSEPRVPVGEPVEAVFKYEDAIEGMKVSVFVHEFDASGKTTEVKRFEDLELSADNGEMKFSFTRTEAEAAEDLREDQSAGETNPLEYRYFVVAEDGTKSEASEELWLTNTVKVNLNNAEAKTRVVVLRDATGEEKRVRAENGAATFEDVVVGPIEVRLAEPRFTGLGWSMPRVPVGTPVEVVFKYEDAIAEMKVTVVISAFSFSHGIEELDRITVTLPDTRGEARAVWMRKGGAGAAGSSELRYHVTTEDGKTTNPSSALR